MIEIDGSFMEGGGQILRTALALSTLTGKPFVVDNIRHNRPKPGLKAQHLSCLDALQRLASARVQGARLAAVRLSFQPQPVAPGKLVLDIGTAGSITLLLQSLLLPCMFAGAAVRLCIKGGTDTRWSIPLDYFTHVILPFLNPFATVKINEVHRGFYPKGRGLLDLTITPRFCLHLFKTFDSFHDHLRKHVSRIHLARQLQPDRIEGRSLASVQLKSAGVAGRQAAGAEHIFTGRFAVRIEEAYCQTASVGTVITLWAVSRQGQVSLGADALGQKGRRAEDVGAAAAGRLLHALKSGAAVDRHLADNLIPLLALCGGEIKTEEISGHIQSNIYVCEKFLDVQFRIDEERNIITVE